MADGNILSNFGIDLLEEEIDDVIFQTNEFLTDATFTGGARAILVVSVFLRFLSLATFCKPTICKILFRETNPGRDKNGTKPQENKIKNASSPASLVMDFSFLCKGTILSREKQAISYKYVVNQPFISHGHFQEDTANASHTDLCCLFQRSVKICFMPFVHYGISAVAHCLGQMYNPPAIISNAECVSNQ